MSDALESWKRREHLVPEVWRLYGLLDFSGPQRTDFTRYNRHVHVYCHSPAAAWEGTVKVYSLHHKSQVRFIYRAPNANRVFVSVCKYICFCHRHLHLIFSMFNFPSNVTIIRSVIELIGLINQLDPQGQTVPSNSIKLQQIPHTHTNQSLNILHLFHSSIKCHEKSILRYPEILLGGDRN